MLKQLQTFQKKVNQQLEQFFTKKINQAQKVDSSSVEMLKLLKEYTLRGGKRLRPAFLYYGYHCFKQNKPHQVLKASLSIELIQSFLLIHDDIIDNSSLRRNGPTLHKSYQKIAKKYKTDKKHFGLSMAIIAGDILAAFSNEIITKTNFKEKNKNAALQKLNHIIHKVVYGQALDILSELKPIQEQDIEKIHHLKTTSYTIEGPLHIGALLAGANKKQLQSLSNYALPLGKAFQIQDDILGLFGNKKKIGKPVDSDLKEGKKTLLILKALQKANPQQKQTIKNALGNQNLTKKQLQQIRNIIKETSSLKYSQDLAKNLIQKAKNSLQKTNFKPKGQQFLIDIADYMLEREY